MENESWKTRTVTIRGIGPNEYVHRLAQELSEKLGFSITGIVETKETPGISRVYASRQVGEQS